MERAGGEDPGCYFGKYHSLTDGGLKKRLIAQICKGYKLPERCGAGQFLQIHLRSFVEGIISCYTDIKRKECYQIIVILEGVVQGGDPLAVSIYQHIALLTKTCRLEKEAIMFKIKRLTI